MSSNNSTSNNGLKSFNCVCKVHVITKRDGSYVNFDKQRIFNAIISAMKETESEYCDETANVILRNVITDLNNMKEKVSTYIPNVEDIQEIVESQIVKAELAETAKKYIRYRYKKILRRKKIARLNKLVPKSVKELFRESKQYFNSDLNEFVYIRSYAKWLEKEKRRECWIETVDRYMDYMKTKLSSKLTEDEYALIRKNILNQSVMPSMRLMQFAGDACDVSNVCAYNCAYIAPECINHLADIMYICMCGTGVGFSVEALNVGKFPQVKYQTNKENHPNSPSNCGESNNDEATNTKKWVVPDTTEGWCDALKYGLNNWFEGNDVEFDYSLVRPEGVRLKTKGGRASGPAPLKELLNFCRAKVLSRQGTRLNPIDIYDIICMIGKVIMCGGVRRTAMISLSDLNDESMRNAKSTGNWFKNHPYRSKTNNSAAYNKKPDIVTFIDEWKSLIEGRSGERGIFNRGNVTDTMPQRRIDLMKEDGIISPDGIIYGYIGGNPCMEIILRSMQFCNLSEVIARPYDTKESLLEKIRIATILGTYQSTLTDFKYISDEWRQNCERERLLGVSITGQWDCPAVRDSDVLEDLKKKSITTNEIYAERFGISPSASITCVKPSGTVSQVVDCSSGLHARYSEYYIRRIRISKTDSLFKMIKESTSIPYFPENGQTMENADTFVLEFPVKSPESSTYISSMNAIDQLNYWKKIKVHYTEHNPSVTIHVGNDEWMNVMHWVYSNWELIGGISFLPKDDTVYDLAPYEEISKEEYFKRTNEMGKIDFSQIISFEKTDSTSQKAVLACSGDHCEIYA